MIQARIYKERVIHREAFVLRKRFASHTFWMRSNDGQPAYDAKQLAS